MADPEDGAPTRAQPYYCPWCGEQDFVPGEAPGQYYCESCNRRWALRLLGLGR